MRNYLLPIKSLFFAAFSLFILAQCSEEEIVPTESAAPTEEITAVPVEATGSMTISGVYTSYEDVKDCTTCTFVVPSDMLIVDGKELGLKPGAIICLDKAVRYGDVEFVNLQGTEDKPITIGSTDRTKI